MALDKFTGKKTTRLSLYGNEINKRMLLVGLGGQKKYNTDVYICMRMLLLFFYLIYN